MRLLFPSDTFDPTRPDDAYADEHVHAKQTGFAYSLFSFEDLELGRFRSKPSLRSDDLVLYRGWMMPPERYAGMATAIEALDARPLVSPAQYLLCHHLPNWYPLLSEFTAETVALPRDADFVEALRDKQWPAYFVKDYVKSLNTGRGSLVYSTEDIAEVVALLEKYRDTVEGGVCVRRGEDLDKESEERYFVFQSRAYAREGEVPFVVEECAKRVDSPFFSVDVARRTDGVLRIVELGDGQVSDRKRWPLHRFYDMLKTAL